MSIFRLGMLATALVALFAIDIFSFGYASGDGEFEDLFLKAAQDEKQRMERQGKEIEELKQKAKEEEMRILFGDWVNLEERTRFIRVVVAMIGTPYKYGGNSVRGTDCSWFTQSMYKLFDVSLPRITQKQFLVGKPVDREHLEEGDLVFFDGTGKPLHVGIYISAGKFVHSSSLAKQVRVDFLDTPWQFKRFIGGVRIRELKSESIHKR